jgi:hypothetical protein
MADDDFGPIDLNQEKPEPVPEWVIEARELRRNLANAELVLQQLAKRRENVDTTNLYWVAKLGRHELHSADPSK